MKRWLKWLLFSAIWVAIPLHRQVSTAVTAVVPSQALHSAERYLAFLPIVAVLVLIVMLALRFAQTSLFMLHLLFFPLFIAGWLIWRIPFAAYRFWRFSQRLPGLIVNVTTAIETTSIAVIVGGLSALCVLRGWYLQLSGVYLATLLGWIALLHANLFIFAFRPGLTQRRLVDLFLLFWRYEKAQAEQPPRPIRLGQASLTFPPPTLSASQRWGQRLVAHLEGLKGKPIPVRMFTRGLVVYFLLATFLFAAIYYELITMDPTSFALLGPRAFSDVWLFSIANMLTTN